MQPMSRRGMTMIELVVSMAVTVVIGLVVAALFRAVIFSSRRTIEQIAMLSNERIVLQGQASQRGLLWDEYEAATVMNFSTYTITLQLPRQASIAYAVSSSGTLVRTQLGVSQSFGGGLLTLGASYYNMDYAGTRHILVSTDPASTAMTAESMTFVDKTGTPHYDYSGVWLRN